MKLARRVTGRPAIVAFQGAFHGRTYGATSITSSSPNYRLGHEPLLPSIYLAPFPEVWREFDGDEARATEVSLARLGRLRARCAEHGILLVADEVQSGYGRTGRMWAFEHAGIVPDVVCIAKAIANGLPLSAIAARRELHERGGGGLVANAATRGAELTAGLGRLMAEDERIGDVRGPGLMVGVELVTDRAAKAPDGALADQVVARAAGLGLLGRSG